MYGTHAGGIADSKGKKVLSIEYLCGYYNFSFSYMVANYLKNKHIFHHISYLIVFWAVRFNKPNLCVGFINFCEISSGSIDK